MDSQQKKPPKPIPIALSRREFLVFTSQLSILLQTFAVVEAVAKPTYNIAFWQQVSTGPGLLQVSEIFAAVVVAGSAGELKVSEILAAVAAAGTDGALNVSEILAAVATAGTGSLNVSEVTVAVAALP